MSTERTEQPHGENTADRERKGPDDHPFKVTVRTLAGHQHPDTVKPSDTVGALTVEAVKRFVSSGELEDGPYALTLPRSGDAELDPTASLRETGVVEGDVLVLLSRLPQVDG